MASSTKISPIILAVLALIACAPRSELGAELDALARDRSYVCKKAWSVQHQVGILYENMREHPDDSLLRTERSRLQALRDSVELECRMADRKSDSLLAVFGREIDSLASENRALRDREREVQHRLDLRRFMPRDSMKVME